MSMKVFGRVTIALLYLFAAPIFFVQWLLGASKALKRASHEHHNIVGVQIHGQLWAQPVPLELLVRTEIDLETGKVEIADLMRSRVV